MTTLERVEDRGPRSPWHEDIEANIAVWAARHDDQLTLGRRQWSASEPTWGVFGVPESVAGLLPDDLDGAGTAEIGCGTAYVSAWLARRGARAVGVDPTPGQLALARKFQDEFELWFPLVRAAGEQLPMRAGCFDLVISEYGAAIWADPYRWIPEAARLLRPGGELVVLANSALLMLCLPDEDGVTATERLVRPHFADYRFAWLGEQGVEFHLGHGDWIRLLRANNFDVEDLIELRPTMDAATDNSFVTLEWARQWPCEEVWRARRH